MADEIDPRLVDALVSDILAEKARKANPQRFGAPLPTLPTLPYNGPEIRNLNRPGSVTLPAEQGAARGMAGIVTAPVDATRSAVELYDNARHGDIGPAAKNAMELGMLGMNMRGSTPKWAREQPRFGPSETSEIGALPWIAGGVGAGGLGYAGSQLDDKDDHKGAVMGALLGGALGFGGSLPLVRSRVEQIEREVHPPEPLTGVGRRAPHPLDRATALEASTPMPPPEAPQSAARMRLIDRLRSSPIPDDVRQPLEPADLAGPTGAKGTVRNNKGEAVSQDERGNWRHEKTGRFSEPPDTEAMGQGFSDADLAASKKR